MKLFAKDHLLYQGDVIRPGDELPADVPADLLDHWRDQGVIAVAPVRAEAGPPAEEPADAPPAEEPAEAGPADAESDAPPAAPAPRRRR